MDWCFWLVYSNKLSFHTVLVIFLCKIVLLILLIDVMRSVHMRLGEASYTILSLMCLGKLTPPNIYMLDAIIYVTLQIVSFMSKHLIHQFQLSIVVRHDIEQNLFTKTTKCREITLKFELLNMCFKSLL